MKITILNGSPSPDALESYLERLIPLLEKEGNTVTHLKLRDINLRACNGCYKCWVRTPGRCVLKDDSDLLDRTVIQSDFVLWATPLVMAFQPPFSRKRWTSTCRSCIPIWRSTKARCTIKPATRTTRASACWWKRSNHR
jgi:hypothetical protein